MMSRPVFVVLCVVVLITGYGCSEQDPSHPKPNVLDAASANTVEGLEVERDHRLDTARFAAFLSGAPNLKASVSGWSSLETNGTVMLFLTVTNSGQQDLAMNTEYAEVDEDASYLDSAPPILFVDVQVDEPQYIWSTGSSWGESSRRIPIIGAGCRFVSLGVGKTCRLDVAIPQKAFPAGIGEHSIISVRLPIWQASAVRQLGYRVVEALATESLVYRTARKRDWQRPYYPTVHAISASIRVGGDDDNIYAVNPYAWTSRGELYSNSASKVLFRSGNPIRPFVVPDSIIRQDILRHNHLVDLYETQDMVDLPFHVRMKRR